MKYISFISGIATLLLCIANHYNWFRRGQQRQQQNEDTPSAPQNSSNPQTESPFDETKLKECLDMNNMWIGNSDQKAGMLLATIGIALTILLTSDALKAIRKYIAIPFIQYCEGEKGINFCFSRFAVFCFLLTTAVAAIVSLYYLLNTIKPNIDYDSFHEKNPGMVRKSHIFYGSVASMSYQQFKDDIFDYKEDLRSQVFTNAKIAYTKFQNYLKGFFWFKMMMLSAAMLFISIMLMQ